MKLCTNVKIRQLIFSLTNNNSNTDAVLVPAHPAVKKTINNLISRFPGNVEFFCSFFPLCSFHISFIFRLHCCCFFCHLLSKVFFKNKSVSSSLLRFSAKDSVVFIMCCMGGRSSPFAFSSKHSSNMSLYGNSFRTSTSCNCCFIA